MKSNQSTDTFTLRQGAMESREGSLYPIFRTLTQQQPHYKALGPRTLVGGSENLDGNGARYRALDTIELLLRTFDGRRNRYLHG